MKEAARKRLQIRFDFRKYSRLGMASFLIALVTSLLVIVDIGLVVHYQADPGAIKAFQVLDPWLTWLAAFLAFAGIVVGFTAVVQKQKQRLFGWVGLIVNGLFLLGIISLYVLNILAFMRSSGV